MRADYEFSTSEIAGVAAEAASCDLHELGYLLTQAPVSWHWLEEGANPQNMIGVRQGLTELAGAAYALQDATTFLAATETLLRYSLASSRRYTAPPAQLLLDVALGVALRRPESAHQAAAAILAAGVHDAPALSMPLEAAARTLAHLALGGMSMAELSAQAVASTCTTQRNSRHTTAYFTAWADAVVALARDDGERLHEALSRVNQVHHAQLQADLVRAARGHPADWSSADFWDWLTAPLVAVARECGRDTAKPPRYSDAGWTAAAAMSD